MKCQSFVEHVAENYNVHFSRIFSTLKQVSRSTIIILFALLDLLVSEVTNMQNLIVTAMKLLVEFICKPMNHLPTIISTYEEKFEEKFSEKGYRDSNGYTHSFPHFDGSTLKQEIKEFIRQFAADLVREAFANTKLESVIDTENNNFSKEKMILLMQAEGWNFALSEVETRQQEFINEQQ